MCTLTMLHYIQTVTDGEIELDANGEIGNEVQVKLVNQIPD